MPPATPPDRCAAHAARGVSAMPWVGRRGPLDTVSNRADAGCKLVSERSSTRTHARARASSVRPEAARGPPLHCPAAAHAAATARHDTTRRDTRATTTTRRTHRTHAHSNAYLTYKGSSRLLLPSWSTARCDEWCAFVSVGWRSAHRWCCSWSTRCGQHEQHQRRRCEQLAGAATTDAAHAVEREECEWREPGCTATSATADRTAATAAATATAGIAHLAPISPGPRRHHGECHHCPCDEFLRRRRHCSSSSSVHPLVFAVTNADAADRARHRDGG